MYFRGKKVQIQLRQSEPLKFQCLNSAESVAVGAAVHNPQHGYRKMREQPMRAVYEWSLSAAMFGCALQPTWEEREHILKLCRQSKQSLLLLSLHFWATDCAIFLSNLFSLLITNEKKIWRPTYKATVYCSHGLQEMDESAWIFWDRIGLNFMGRVNSLRTQKWMNDWLTLKLVLIKAALCNWMKKNA